MDFCHDRDVLRRLAGEHDCPVELILKDSSTLRYRAGTPDAVGEYRDGAGPGRFVTGTVREGVPGPV